MNTTPLVAVILCCFTPASSNTALPKLLYKLSIVFKSLELHPLLFSFVRGADPLFLRPASRPPSFPSSFIRSVSLPPSFPAPLPPPCFVSSFPSSPRPSSISPSRRFGSSCETSSWYVIFILLKYEMPARLVHCVSTTASKKLIGRITRETILMRR